MADIETEIEKIYTENELNEQKEIEEKRLKRKKKLQKERALFALAVLLLVALTVLCVLGVGQIKKSAEKSRIHKEEIKQAEIDLVISEADRLSLGYDYDAAIEKIKSYSPDYLNEQNLADALLRYESAKQAAVRYENVNDITHVFFHTLIVDTSKAFDGDYMQNGYNQYMTTVSEFKKMLDEMYKRGYVLVDIHDIAKEVPGENGNVKFVPGDIMLPPGKIPFVMSQDDVSYYNYMTYDGFASKIVIGDDGYPTCEYITDDGSVVYGDYDLVPILENFIKEHPDFSYKGARATLAITGYDGVLGYRTCPGGDGYNPDDIEKAKQVAARMVECGWTFASHSWGHQQYGKISVEKMKTDAQKWNSEVKPILGDVDVLIYANGSDIAGIEKYSGEKYEILKAYGFKYFCNVDSARAWVQITDDYVRQGRRNLDGYRMWYSPGKLKDLFNVEDVWDNSRPTPVAPI